MNKYKKRSTQFLKDLILYCSTALICSILCLSPFWLPSLYASIKAFLFVSVPNFGVLFINPKCLFIVSNVIVIFLIGESKFLSSKSSPATEIYDEYVKRSSSLRRHPSSEEIEVKETKLEDQNATVDSVSLATKVMYKIQIVALAKSVLLKWGEKEGREGTYLLQWKPPATGKSSRAKMKPNDNTGLVMEALQETMKD
ncbi:hypothetical protein IFM89_029297 [Coptis chinensis]|uniref:DUF4408 domain-containing protein n=1 Tax=Coptis chinensis TaxID=261450 RepID=A0A835HVH5_9MAGN|nr:hypothetical protein IFM89_029297 [Coptis chinensis]